MNVKIPDFVKSKQFVLLSVGALSFSSGFAAGYLFRARRFIEMGPEEFLQLQFNFEEAVIYDQETDVEPKEESEEGEEKSQREVEKILDTEGYISDEDIDYEQFSSIGRVVNPRPDPRDITVVNPPPARIEPVRVNVFEQARPTSEWDYETEVASRTSKKPYILHQEEFFNNEMDFTQSTLTYYSGDDILADEQDVPIYNYQETVGKLRFGHGSNDANVVYIRNERLHMEYEVLLSTGSFEVEVLGFEVEKRLQHSDHKDFVHKFKLE